jgi:Tfp pilus assembly protein PilP
VATSVGIPRRAAALLIACCGLALAGCGAGDKAVTEFAGGTSSKDKQPIPPAVQAGAATATAPAPVEASANPAAPAAAPAAGLKGPAVASKAEAVDKAHEAGPIRTNSNEYRAGGNRDPFASLIGTDERTDLVDLSVVRLVGVVTSGEKPFAIVEDGEGVSYVLRKGDRVKNGRVVRVTPAALVCSQTMLGYTTTIQLKLEQGKDVKNG